MLGLQGMKKCNTDIVKNYIRCLLVMGCGFVVLFINQTLISRAEAVCAEDMAQFEGVTLSPDKAAWTTNYMDRNTEQLEKGHCVLTGMDITLPKLQTGEHYYKSYAQGSLDVYKWEVAWSRAQCIHSFPAQNYHGFETEAGICEKYYHSGWIAYCAACEEPVSDMYIYATKDTVQGITNMPAESEYLYICPHCSGLEQGTHYKHLCKKVSYNHYVVTYDGNAPTNSVVDGYMAVTKHMYNNAAEYNGTSAMEKGYADTKLRKNSFACKGYIFAGWNEKADGSGRSFLDEETVFNLSEIDGAIVTLYAQWEPANSTLVIDANGGTYKGQESYFVTQTYGTKYVLQSEDLREPSGYLVEFETNGGSLVAPRKTNRIFALWEFVGNAKGKMEGNVYTFGGEEGERDLLQARYTDEAFLLPDSQKENELLVGWYTDKSLSGESYLGRPGDEVCISESCTLYAKWSALTLWAEDNYKAYGGIGAVDLEWQQKDAEKLYYKLYQSRDQQTWSDIYDASSPGEEIVYSERVDVEASSQQIDVGETGYYRLQAFGEKHTGNNVLDSEGLAGSVQAEYWLQKGDVLEVCEGTNGTDAQSGTDTALYLVRDGLKKTLLVAGGGVSNRNVETPSRTTLENPAKEDIAFKSKITEMFPSGTVVYVLFNNHTSYPTLKISGEAWAEATGSVTVGGLNRTLETRRTNYVHNASGVEDHWGEEIVATAQEGVAPRWGNVQVAGGFSRTFVATYPTNGNTNLVVSAAIYNWSQNTDGDIRFRILNATTGAVLYDETPVLGFSGLDGYVRVTEVLTWADYDVSNVKEVTVEVYIKQVAGGGAHTTVSLFDTFFYGKTIGSESDTSTRSNYINTDFGCRNASNLTQVHAGTGYAMIESVDVGYQDTFALKEVCARDTEAPEKVSDVLFLKGEDAQLQVQISPPSDMGTTYYHKVHSFCLKEEEAQSVSISNITQNTLLTGIAGYYYYIDEQIQGNANHTHNFSKSLIWHIDSSNQDKYIHIAAVDQAGNIGKTASFLITGIEESEIEDTLEIHTVKPYVVDTEYVYKKEEDIYYVKADGKTEHTICSSAYLLDLTTSNRQIERMRIYADDTERIRWFEVEVPYGDVAKQEEIFLNDTLKMALSDISLEEVNVGAARAYRKEHGRVLEVEHNFCIEASKKSIEMYPQALMEVDGKECASKIEESLQQSITIIPDAICPYIVGMDELLQLNGYDWEVEIDDILLWAYDRQSGMEEFFVTITNKDNQLERTYYGSEVDEIWIPVNQSDPLFMGELSFLVVAVDRVGNANVIGENGLTFTLDASVSKERAPEEHAFKMGEGAVLEIATSGYVERIEVMFPEAWQTVFPEMNQVYIYEQPQLRTKETKHFSVPLETTAQIHEIIVIAYKNGEMLTRKPTVMVLEESVLDELHTRIRNNG